MSKRRSPNTPEGEAAQAFGNAVGQAFKSLSGLNVPAQALQRLQSEYVTQAAAIWNQALPGAAGGSAPALTDKRFAADPWATHWGTRPRLDSGQD